MAIGNVTIDTSYAVRTIEYVTVDKAYVVRTMENVRFNNSYVIMTEQGLLKHDGFLRHERVASAG